MIKPRHLRRLLPLELKDLKKVNKSTDADMTTASSSTKLKFHAVIVKKDENRKVINLPKQIHPQLEGKKDVIVVPGKHTEAYLKGYALGAKNCP